MNNQTSKKSFLLIQLLIFIGLRVPASGYSSSKFDTPEKVVTQHILFFLDAEFNKSAKALHREYLQEYKDKIITIMNRLEGVKRNEVLNSYGFKSIDEMKQTPNAEFYALMMHARLKTNTEQGVKQYKKYTQNIQHKIVNKVQTGNNQYELLVNAKVIYNNKLHSNNKLYVVKLTDDEWKIIDISES